jgi:hypothetical protein
MNNSLLLFWHHSLVRWTSSSDACGDPGDLGLFHTAPSVKLLKPASNCSADKRLSSTCKWKFHSTVTLDLLSANRVTLCFLLHACHCTNVSDSAYYSWKCMCMYMKNVSTEAYWYVSENFLSTWTCYGQFHLYISLPLKSIMSQNNAGLSFWSKRVQNNLSQGITVLLSTHNPKTQDYWTQRNS